MKSLHKTFDILEYIVLQCGRHVTPSEVAEYANLNIATCTRIMGELVERGYLDKISRKAGYVPGPMVVSIGTRDNCYRRLAAAASEPVRLLAERVCMVVNLAVMNRDRRVMLCFHSCRRNWTPWNSFTFGGDHATTATGWLLLSAMEPEEAEKIIRAKNLSVTRKELELTRKRGWVNFISPEDGIRVMGHLISVDGYPPAAIGFGIRKEDDPEEILSLSEDAARKIQQKLTPDSRAF